MKNFQGVFRGAAYLGGAVGLLNIPWPFISPFLKSFPFEINDYLEFSVDEKGEALGIMTKGNDKDFVFRVARLMETHDIEKERIKRFLVLARFFEHRNLFFKIELDKKGVAEFSYYFRKRPTIDTAKGWLESLGVDTKTLQIVSEVAAKLEKRTVHFLASAESREGQSLLKIYFTQPIQASSFHKIQQTSYLTGISAIEWENIVTHRDLLETRQLFISLSFYQGKLVPGIKLDIQKVGKGVLWDLIKTKEDSQEIKKRYQLFFDLFKREDVDYLGLHIRPGQSPTSKVYFHMKK